MLGTVGEKPSKVGVEMHTCKHCGSEIETGFHDGQVFTWRHAAYPHQRYCIVDGQLSNTVAEPSE
jgi:hypothetical protein